MINEELFDGFLEIDPNGPTEEGQPSLTEVPACKGILLFTDTGNKPIQLLIAGNLRRTARARLSGQEAKPLSKKPDITQIASRLYYICCYNNFLNTLTHYKITRAVFGKNYEDSIILPKLSLVKIDPSAKWPAFSVVASMAVSNSQEKVFGPFPNRKSANEFVCILKKAFTLCRRSDLVDNPEKAAGCPYLQMGICPAPCVGNITTEEYFRQIDKAIIAASGFREHLKTILTKEMELYSEKMEFEKASSVKKRIEQLILLENPSYKWTCDLDNLSVLHIDVDAKISEEGKRGKTQTFAAFHIKAGCIHLLRTFTLEGLDEFNSSVLNNLQNRQEKTNPTGKENDEMLALLTYHLYRSNPSGLWLNISSGPPSSQQLSRQIKETFKISD